MLLTIDLWNYQLFAMCHQFKDCDLLMRIVILLALLLYNMIVYISMGRCYGMVPSLLVLCLSSAS